MSNTNTENNNIYIEIRGIRVTEEQAAEVKEYFKNHFNYIFSQINWIKDNGIIRGCGQLDKQKVQDDLEEMLKEVAEEFEYLKLGLLFTDEPLESYIELCKVAPFKEQWKIKDNIDYEINEDGTVKLNEYGKRKVLINLVYGGLCDHIRGSLIVEGRYNLNKLMLFIYYDNQTFHDVNAFNDNLHVNWDEFDIRYNTWFDGRQDKIGKILTIRGKHVEDKEEVKRVRDICYLNNEERFENYDFINNDGDIYLNSDFNRSMFNESYMTIYYEVQRITRQLSKLEMLVIVSKRQNDVLDTMGVAIWICNGKWKVLRDKEEVERLLKVYEGSCKSLEVRAALDFEINQEAMNNYHSGKLNDFELEYINMKREQIFNKKEVENTKPEQSLFEETVFDDSMFEEPKNKKKKSRFKIINIIKNILLIKK